MRAKFVNECVSFNQSRDPLPSLNIGITPKIIAWLNLYYIKDYMINDDLTIDVYGDVILTNNDIIEFPEYIKFNNITGRFLCDYCLLKNLKGCPTSVGGSFYCDHNHLINLAGCPEKIGGTFVCTFNHLTDLVNGPKLVQGSYLCSYNNLISLNGCVTKLRASFDCSDNRLRKLGGCPKTVRHFFKCNNNKTKFKIDYILDLCKVEPKNIFI